MHNYILAAHRQKKPSVLLCHWLLEEACLLLRGTGWGTPADPTPVYPQHLGED